MGGLMSIIAQSSSIITIKERSIIGRQGKEAIREMSFPERLSFIKELQLVSSTIVTSAHGIF